MTRQLLSVVLTGIVYTVVSGCSTGSDKPSDPPADPKVDPVPEPQTTTPEPALAAGSNTDPTLKEHMSGHFVSILEIERALVDGDLEAAKKKARALAEHQPHDAVEAWDTHLKAVEDAARALTNATDLAGATKLAAALGSECASCHLTTTAISSFPYKEPPPESGDNKAMMKRHQWATDRLWEGLIGPSETSWVEGAEMLAKAPFVPQVTLLEKDRAMVVKLAKKVHELGGKAAAESDAKARADIYAELLTTCSSCHAIARPR